MTTPTGPDVRPKRQGPTPERVIRAAVLCYLDDETDEEIAAELGVCRRTLARWKHRSEFLFAEQVIDELTFEQSVRAMAERRLAILPRS